MQAVKQIGQQKKSKFIKIDMQLHFILTVTKNQIDQLVSRAINEGIGDWGMIDQATRVRKHKNQIIYTVPFHVIDIETNVKYLITKQKLLRGIRDGLIDFPYALDTEAGYNLNINKLNQEDIDEIVQIATFRKIKYKFI